MARKHASGELELSVLKILRDKGLSTVAEMVQLLDNGSHYTTIMTVMSRLVEKKELVREKKGRQYEYQINEQGNQHSLTLFDRLKEKVFNGKALSMVSYLLNSTEDISDKELKQMEQLISSERKTRKS